MKEECTGDTCILGRELKERTEEMRRQLTQLEDRFYKVILGGLSFVVLQLITLITILLKR